MGSCTSTNTEEETSETIDIQSDHLVYHKTNGQATSCNWSPGLLKITGVQLIYKATTSITLKIIAKRPVDASHLTIRIGCQSKKPPPHIEN